MADADRNMALAVSARRASGFPTAGSARGVDVGSMGVWTVDIFGLLFGSWPAVGVTETTLEHCRVREGRPGGRCAGGT